MGRYFIYAILLYALVVVIYLLWERKVKRGKNTARKKGYNLFHPVPKEDIIGKSKFTLRHSQPQATTLEINEKAIENAVIFAGDNGQTDPRGIPAAVLRPAGETGTVPENSEADSGEIDIVIENEPEGESDTGEEGDLDVWETEGTEDESAGGRATGIGFEELAGMARMVANAGCATPREREEAGRVLAEVRMTDIIGQIAPDEPKKKVVSALMDDYFAAYYRLREADPAPAVKAPADFDVRGFA
ncbi:MULTISPECIES: hypothetical protein [unclassified Bacteroides]|jgi:hypothetical protein|uniref:hypothetical protein n=1 Tax=unclassified Bacteroides TaxID=2646097 RepID=UPI000E9C6776|nr:MULTISPECIES: hypothetical protein [unclassified Bacteroides]RGN46598.1 hypothetical protein DXB63_10535 [Bacteroides sp. OM05-12]RHR74593.1 hypothetical protein DWW69_12700 [Bacteroides sp. AF16-49]